MDSFSEATAVTQTSLSDLRGSVTSLTPIDTVEMSTRILDIIFDYTLDKFTDTQSRLNLGRPKFLAVIDRFVEKGARIDMCLPAFPFKSANKEYKVLGILPDKAEELALGRLNTMCLRIGQIYAPGAKVVIISDGLTYNGKLGWESSYQY